MRSLRPNQAEFITLSLASPSFKKTPAEAAGISPLHLKSNDVPQCCTLTLVCVSAALYPFIDACLASIPALIGRAIHYPSVCLAGLLNDLSD